jgi:hypothetical protein
MVAFAGFTDFLTSGQGADVVEVSPTELIVQSDWLLTHSNSELVHRPHCCVLSIAQRARQVVLNSLTLLSNAYKHTPPHVYTLLCSMHTLHSIHTIIT